MQPSSILPFALAVGLTGSWASAAGAEPPSHLPVLLVHGMVWQIDGEDVTWGCLADDGRGGERFGGMVGFLSERGVAYGGAIRPAGGRVGLPASLDARGATTPPHEARLFVLKFSPSANTDGLAYKALELAEAIRQVRQLTGAAFSQNMAFSLRRRWTRVEGELDVEFDPFGRVLAAALVCGR